MLTGVAIVLLVLGGVFFGWFKPLACLFVMHSISTMQNEAERQKVEQAKSEPRA
jgi:hypothetical protein